MNRILKYGFWSSLFAYLCIVTITRFGNTPMLDPISRALYSTPVCAFFEYLGGGTKGIEAQIFSLSSKEVADLLKTNNENMEDHFNGKTGKSIPPKEYIMVQLQDNQRSTWGDLKCYLSDFSHPIVFYANISSAPFEQVDKNHAYQRPGYQNFLIIPFPSTSSSSKSCHVTLHWKNYWRS